MKKIAPLLIIALCCFFVAQAQEKAITESGKEVYLNTDGTWEYIHSVESNTYDVYYNPKKFTKDPSSSFPLKSKKSNMTFWLNPKKWSIKTATDNDDAEYQVTLKGEDLYAMMITEKIQVPLESLKDIAVENGRSLSPDLKVVKEEYRKVNGMKVLHLEMFGTVQGIKFAYSGYYYSDENGTTQFVTFTSQNLIKNYRTDINKLLNGLMLTK